MVRCDIFCVHSDLCFRNKHLHIFLVLNETVRNICDCLVVTSYICGVTILKQAILIRLNRFVNLTGQTIAEFVSTDSYSWFYIFISEVTVCFFCAGQVSTSYECHFSCLHGRRSLTIIK